MLEEKLMDTLSHGEFGPSPVREYPSASFKLAGIA